MVDTTTKIGIGALLILILSSAYYITLQDKGVKIRVDDDKSTFYVLNDNNRFIVAGREYSKLLDGTSLLYRDVSLINRTIVIDEHKNTTEITRVTPYKRGPVIKETWYFDGNINDVELFPIEHKIEVFNGTGFYYKYEVRELFYNGSSFKLDGEQTSMDFEKNIKVTWWEGYRLGWVYKSGSMYVKSEKIENDYEVFDVRLFDPIIKPANWIIDGDSVYVNTTDYFIRVTPHTVYNVDEYVTIEYEDKKGIGDVDLMLGFTNDTAELDTGLEKKYYNETIEHPYYCNATKLNATKDTGYCWRYQPLNVTSHWSLVYEHSYDRIDLKAKTMWWNTTVEKFKWVNLSQTYKEKYVYEDVTEWYYKKNMTIDKSVLSVAVSSISKTKITKAVFDVKFPTDADGKYYVCIKPTKYSISSADIADELFCLDPWYYTEGGSPELYYAIGSGYDTGWDNESDYNTTLSSGVDVTADSLTLDLGFFNNLTIYHSYDDADGTNIDDLSGTIEHNGTKKGAGEPAQRLGVNNNGTLFDGGNDYYTIYDGSAMSADLSDMGNNNNNYTMACWMNCSGCGSGNGALWFADDTMIEIRTKGSNPRDVPLMVGVNQDKLMFSRAVFGSSDTKSSSTSVNTGEWVHFAVVYYDNLSGYIYLDGALDSAHVFGTVTGDTSLGGDDAYFTFGSRSTDAGGRTENLYAGELDECALWKRALSASEILSLQTEFYEDFLSNGTFASQNISINYTTQEAVIDACAWASPIAFWKLGDDGTDCSGKGYDLTGTDPDYTGEVADFVAASSEYLEVSNASFFADLGTNPFTVCFNYTGDLANEGYLVSNMEAAANDLGLQIRQDGAANPIRYKIGVASSLTSAYTVGQNHEWCFTRNVTSKTIYQDGVWKIGDTNVGTATPSNSMKFTLCRRADAGASYCDGELRDMAVYDYAFSSQNVTDRYNKVWATPAVTNVSNVSKLMPSAICNLPVGTNITLNLTNYADIVDICEWSNNFPLFNPDNQDWIYYNLWLETSDTTEIPTIYNMSFDVVPYIYQITNMSHPDVICGDSTCTDDNITNGVSLDSICTLNNPIAAWPLTTDGTDCAKDYDLTPSGAGITFGDDGATFVPNEQLVHSNTSFTNFGTDPFTVSFNISATGASDKAMFDHLDAGANTGWNFRFNGPNNFGGITGGVWIDNNDCLLTSDVWYEVTYRKNATHQDVFRDGVRCSTVSSTGSVNPATPRAFWIGNQIDTTSRGMTGSINNVEIFDFDLSSEQIAERIAMPRGDGGVINSSFTIDSGNMGANFTTINVSAVCDLPVVESISTFQVNDTFEDGQLGYWGTFEGSIVTGESYVSPISAMRLDDNEMMKNETMTLTSDLIDIRFSLNISDVGSGSPLYVNLRNSGDGLLFALGADAAGGSIRYYTGSWNAIGDTDARNTWKKLRVVFNTTDDICSIWVDDVLQIDAQNCQYPAGAGVVAKITFDPSGSTPNTEVLFDDIVICDGGCVEGEITGTTNITCNISMDGGTTFDLVDADVCNGVSDIVLTGSSKDNLYLACELITEDTSVKPTMINLTVTGEFFTGDIAAPICSLISRTPADVEENSTGIYELLINCTDPSGINETSFIITRTVENEFPADGDNHWSLRVPSNDKGTADVEFDNETILLADGRALGNMWWESEGIFSDNYSYAVTANTMPSGQNPYVNLTCDATSCLMNYSAPVEAAVFPSTLFLSRGKMEVAQKFNYSIDVNDGLFLEFWDGKKAHGDENYTTSVFFNVGFKASSVKLLEFYYCNSSYNVSGGVAPQDENDNCAYLNAFSTSDIANGQSYASRNSSYVKGTYVVTNGKIGGVGTTNKSYGYLRSTVTSTKSYHIRYANGSSGTNVSFADSGVAWTSSNDGDSFVQANFTPDIWFSQITEGSESHIGYYVKDNLGNAKTNFSFIIDEIGLVNHPIGKPGIAYYNNGTCTNGACDNKDEDLNGTYYDNMTIHVNVAIDPDSVGNVSHNLTLRNTDGSWNHTINTSFYSADDSDVHIYFDTSVVGLNHGLYKMNISAVADDNAADVQSRLTEANFTIVRPPTFNQTLSNITHPHITSTLSYGVNCSASSSSSLIYSLGSNLSGLSIDSVSGLITKSGITILDVGLYYYNVTCDNNYYNTTQNAFINVTDVAPNTESSRISPTTVYTNDTLIGYCNVTDVDGDNLTYYYDWLRDNVSYTSGFVTNRTEGIEYNVNNISSSYTIKGETWILTCNGNDGYVNSYWLNSSSVTILNYPPTWIAQIANTTQAEDFGTVTYLTNLTDYVNDIDADWVIFSVQDENTSEVDCTIYNMTESVSLCYQEFTNVSTTCGGVSSGTYIESTDPISATNFITINYYKPNLARNTSLWQIRHGFSTNVTYNITLPQQCWDAYPSLLRLGVRSGLDGVEWGAGEWGSQPKCYNGTDWVNIGKTIVRTVGGVSDSEDWGVTIDGDWSTGAHGLGTSGWQKIDSTPALVYEEAMWWNITNWALNLTSAGNWSGNASCTLGINDSTEWGENQTFWIEVTGVNDRPYFNPPLANQTGYKSVLFTYDINCDDVEGHTLTYYTNATIFTINSSTGLINFTPVLSDVGEYDINVTCGDDTLNTSGIFTLTIDAGTMLYLDGVGADRKYEFQTTANITSNSTNTIETICLDIGYPGYGDNYTCGTSLFSFLLPLINPAVTIFTNGASFYNFVFDYYDWKYADIELDNAFNITSATISITGIADSYTITRFDDMTSVSKTYYNVDYVILNLTVDADDRFSSAVFSITTPNFLYNTTVDVLNNGTIDWRYNGTIDQYITKAVEIDEELLNTNLSNSTAEVVTLTFNISSNQTANITITSVVFYKSIVDYPFNVEIDIGNDTAVDIKYLGVLSGSEVAVKETTNEEDSITYECLGDECTEQLLYELNTEQDYEDCRFYLQGTGINSTFTEEFYSTEYKESTTLQHDTYFGQISMLGEVGSFTNGDYISKQLPELRTSINYLTMSAYGWGSGNVDIEDQTNGEYELYVSLDNGSNWTQIQNKIRTFISNGGTRPKFRVVLQTDTSRDAQVWVIKVELSDLGTYVKNVTVDITANDQVDWGKNDTFDTDLGLFRVNFGCTEINTYLDSGNCTGLTCEVPINITFKGPGNLTVSNYHFGSELGNVTLNKDVIMAHQINSKTAQTIVYGNETGSLNGTEVYTYINVSRYVVFDYLDINVTGAFWR